MVFKSERVAVNIFHYVDIIFIKFKSEQIFGHFAEDKLDTILNTKAEMLQVSMKYLLKNRRQENLMTNFFDYATPCINKRNWRKAASFPSRRKATLKSQRTTEA